MHARPTVAAAPGTEIAVSELEAELVAEVEQLLADWRTRFADRPDLERRRLWLLALEREQIVATAYREEVVARRLDELTVDDDVRALVRQTLVWIWKDEELHAEYLRGRLLEGGGVLGSAAAYNRQIQGALSGWAASTQHHLEVGASPWRSRAARGLVGIGAVLGRVPSVLRSELRFQTFHGYCELNVALEVTAELAYRRLVELANDAEERDTFARIRDDEERHSAAFRVLAAAFTPDDVPAGEVTIEGLLSQLGALSPWFVPAALRDRFLGDADAGAGRPRRFGSGAPVAVASGTTDREKLAVLERCLDRAGLAEVAAGARTAAIRVSFMLGYDRADRSNVNDPELVEGVARYLRRHGVEDVAVLEAPTVYGNCFEHRSVPEVAEYLGFASPEYRVVDIGADLRPFRFERGFVQRTISGTWLDADLRIVMPKLRTDPTEFAHLSLSTLEGSTGAIDETIYAARRTDFRSATMMLLDVAPPDFAVVDAWAPVADGPFGVIGCHHPADVRHVYAGADALAVDEAVLADMGLDDPRRAPIVRRAHHWFGLQLRRPVVDGVRPALCTELRGAHASASLRALGSVSYPIYVYLSRNGELFFPPMDTDAFPPSQPTGFVTRGVRRASQLAFGLRPSGGAG